MGRSIGNRYRCIRGGILHRYDEDLKDKMKDDGRFRKYLLPFERIPSFKHSSRYRSVNMAQTAAVSEYMGQKSDGSVDMSIDLLLGTEAEVCVKVLYYLGHYQ